MYNAYAINTLEYKSELCNGCGMCVAVCPHGVFALNGSKAEIVAYQECMECGACRLNCPRGAISVESGVGCAAAMISAALTGRKEPSCGGDEESACCSDGGTKSETPCCTGSGPRTGSGKGGCC